MSAHLNVNVLRIALCAITVIWPAAARAAQLYVDDDNKTGTASGTTKHPYATVTAALGKAKSGDTVTVAKGSYSENLSISNKTITLLGGAPGGSAADYSGGKGGSFGARNPSAHATKITGTGAQKAVVTLIEAGKSKIDGFVISKGKGRKSGSYAYGGGIYCYGGAPTISHNVIENNDTRSVKSSNGGGIFASDCDATITGNVIRKNRSKLGAGIGAEESSVVISFNTVRDNTADGDHGGGMHLEGPNIKITDNLIAGNEVGRNLSWSWGGGLLVHSKGSTASLARNVVTNNYAAEIGSGEFIDDGAVATIENELIYGNQCPSDGGAGIYVDGADHYSGGPVGSKVTLINVTVANHKCSGQGNGIYIEYHSKVTIKNSIFWGNGGKDFFTKTSSTLSVTYTHSQQGYSGAGNSKADCLLANPAKGDLHLRSKKGRWDPAAGKWVADGQHSPCIDAGEPSSSYSAEPKPNGSRINLGAHGNTKHASLANVGGPPPDMKIPPKPDTITPPKDIGPGKDTVPGKDTGPGKDAGPGKDTGPGSDGSSADASWPVGWDGPRTGMALQGGCGCSAVSSFGQGAAPLLVLVLVLGGLGRRRP